jgi:flagellar biosynthesis protein FliR
VQESRSDPRLRLLKTVLRLSGAATVIAFGAVLLPVDWMAATHEAIGIGEFPRTAVVDYLTRTSAALYGFHGALVLLIARDPVRFRPIVTYVATLNVVFGLMLIAIDLHAGMPWFWTLVEGPLIMAVGLVLAFLNRTTPQLPFALSEPRRPL